MLKKPGMVDIGAKEKSRREASANCTVLLDGDVLKKIKNNEIPKGDVLECARVAGIMAAKKTDLIIPLCHSIGIDCVEIDFKIRDEKLVITSKVKATAKTGVEMEALVACSAASLTVYDMCKMFSKAIEIQNLCLVEKRGGKSGDYKKTDIT